MTQEMFPLDASPSKDNAYYLDTCEVVGHRPAYAVCLRKCALRRFGPLENQNHAECSAAIGRKNCKALDMRKEEIDAGHSIYFISRPALQADSDERDRNTPALTQKRPVPAFKASRPTTTPQNPLDASTGDYAAAINAALAEKPKADEPTEVPTVEAAVRPAMLPGESPLAYARRMKETGNG